MPDTASNPTLPSTDQDSSSLWRSALKHAALAYLFSRLAIMVGAAIVAAELRADENKIKEAAEVLGITEDIENYMERYINDGFSNSTMPFQPLIKIFNDDVNTIKEQNLKIYIYLL